MFHRLIFVAVTLLAVLLTVQGAAFAEDAEVLDAERQRVDVMKRAATSVVAIFGSGGGGGGSGVLVTPDGYALTNFHVVQGAGIFMKCGLNDGVLYDAVLVGIDPTGDVAIIKLLGRDDFPAAPLGDSDTLRQGDAVFAMGNPFLLATDFHPTVTMGIVSGVHRYQYPSGTMLEYTDCIQTDASINPGNSGGPLFNMAGQVVGINGRISLDKRGRVNVGAGYAISINQIKHFMDHLRSGRVVDHATLGATVATSQDGAVLVSSILEDSAIYRRGLRLDDEIVSFAGRPIRSVNQFKNILGIYPKGWQLPLSFRREMDGEIETKEIVVRLEALHRASELSLDRKPRRPPRGRKPPRRDENDLDRKSEPKSKKKIPEHLARFFIKKSGFVNYYFNQLERDRAMQQLTSWGDFSGLLGRWDLAGKTAQGQEIKIVCSEMAVGMFIGETAYLQQLGDDQQLIDEPEGTGGLLAGLNHFRRLLTRGETGFSEFYYLGSMPLDGEGERVDIVFAELNAAQSQWYFSKQSGALLGFDFWISDDRDPCEVRFEELREFGGRSLPARWIVRHANKEFASFLLDSCKLAPSSKPADEPALQEANR